MQGGGLRGALILAALGCAPQPPWNATDPLDVAHAFVHEPGFRRGVLEASLMDPVREYGELRREHYARDWDRLPIRNLTDLPEHLPDDLGGLHELGRIAFTGYPLTPSRAWQPAVDGTGRSGVDPSTLVEVAVGDHLLPAETCATCHTHRGRAGLANPDLVLSDLHPWPQGTIDPTPDGIDNPTVVPDLRPVRHQRYLHHAGTLRNSLAALAVRIDSLLVTAMHEQARPPPVVPVAIAAWLYSLADSLPEPPEGPGAAVFQATCAPCHQPGDLAEPVPVALVGTDSAATDSPTRGTGRYRVPSLRGVGDRGWLLHDASVRSMAELLDPLREEGGHPFGQDLPPVDRDTLMEFLDGL